MWMIDPVLSEFSKFIVLNHYGNHDCHSDVYMVQTIEGLYRTAKLWMVKIECELDIIVSSERNSHVYSDGSADLHRQSHEFGKSIFTIQCDFHEQSTRHERASGVERLHYQTRLRPALLGTCTSNRIIWPDGEITFLSGRWCRGARTLTMGPTIMAFISEPRAATHEPKLL